MMDADTQLTLTPPEIVDSLVEQLVAQTLDLEDGATTEALVVDSDTANRILTAADRPDMRAVWAGAVTTDWELPENIEASLYLDGSVAGDLHIGESVGGDLHLDGSVGRDLWVGGLIGGNLKVCGSIGKNLYLDGSIGKSLYLDGSVGESLYFGGSVVENLYITGAGSVGRDLWVGGSVGVDLEICGSVGGKGVVTPIGRVVRFRSVRGARFGAEMYLGDRVRIDSCDFRECPDLDKLLLVGTDLFPRNSWRSVDRWRGSRLVKPDEATDAEMASVYRQLRTNLEGRSNRPGAAAFYRGEMRSRFWTALKGGRIPEATVIGLYWLMSGFGLNPWRPVLFFIALAAAATEGFLSDGALGGIVRLEWIDAFQFSIRSMVSFISPPDPPVPGVLDRNEVWLQLALRFLGPLLFTQFVLAIRDRVAR